MNEVEKMYRNSGIKKIELDYPDNFEPFYPEFTAEKQLELIKWLCTNTYRNYIHFRYERDINNWKMECNMVGIRELVKADIQRNYKGEIEDVYITCDNCDTVHNLNKYMDIFD